MFSGLSEELEGEEERFPALTFGQARDLIVRPPLPERRPLPRGFYLTRRKGREIDGRCPCKIEWKGEQDPPPPLRRSYEIERLTKDEYEELKQLFDLRVSMTTVAEMVEVDVDRKVDELGEKLTAKVDKMKEGFLQSVREMSRKNTETSKPQDLEKRIKDEVDQRVKEALRPETAETREISFAGIARYVPFNPLMAIYYGYARAELGYKDSEEQFLTDCIVELFKTVYKKQLSLLDVD